VELEERVERVEEGVTAMLRKLEEIAKATERAARATTGSAESR
jgi:hypothetical protein